MRDIDGQSKLGDAGGQETEKSLGGVGWQIGFVGGYCAETNEEHSPDDFERRGGVMRHLFGTGVRMECIDCGLTVSQENHERLVELSEQKDGTVVDDDVGYV